MLSVSNKFKEALGNLKTIEMELHVATRLIT